LHPVSTMDCGHEDGEISTEIWEDYGLNGYVLTLYQNIAGFTAFTSLAFPRDHLEVTVRVPVTISISKFTHRL
jgi:hypothetical protein